MKIHPETAEIWGDGQTHAPPNSPPDKLATLRYAPLASLAPLGSLRE